MTSLWKSLERAKITRNNYSTRGDLDTRKGRRSFVKLLNLQERAYALDRRRAAEAQASGERLAAQDYEEHRQIEATFG